MRKIIALLSVAAMVSVSCKMETPFSEGGNIGQIYVTAASGAKTVLVKLPGLWKVSTDQPWISTDVNGRNGEGAFTFSYSSNESDMVGANATRKGRLVIEDMSRMTADTIYVIQQGTPDGHEHQSSFQDSYIEFLDTPLTRIDAVYANLQGVESMSAVKEWINSCEADVLCLIWTVDMAAELAAAFPDDACTYDNLVIIDRTGMGSQSSNTDHPASLTREIDGICFTVADFGQTVPQGTSRYGQMQELLSSGYNKPGSGAKWIIGGSFYFLSIMELGYPDTPSWYPENPSDDRFDADIYAQTNNLTDCVWMCNRHFNSTFTSEGKSWRADYIYASNSIWNAAVSVKIGDEPVTGSSHRMTGITVKY